MKKYHLFLPLLGILLLVSGGCSKRKEPKPLITEAPAVETEIGGYITETESSTRGAGRRGWCSSSPRGGPSAGSSHFCRLSMVIMSLEFSRGLNTWMLKKSKPTNRIWESSCHSSGAHWSMGPVTQQAAAAGNGGLFPTQGEMKFSMINSQSCAILFPGDC